MDRKVIKIKKHKCKICKQKYNLTTDMINRYSHEEGIFGTGYYTGFTCPYCKELYIYSTNFIPAFVRPQVNHKFERVDK